MPERLNISVSDQGVHVVVHTAVILYRNICKNETMFEFLLKYFISRTRYKIGSILKRTNVVHKTPKDLCRASDLSKIPENLNIG